jgi:hypothetical protein
MRISTQVRLTLAFACVLVLTSTAHGCGDDGSSGTPDGSPDGDVDTGTPRPDGSSDTGTTDTGPRPDGGPTGDLPSGDMGIAARHPGDEGIGSDSDVIFYDDFESYSDADGLWDNWNGNAFGILDIETDAAGVHAGAQSLRMTQPQQDEEHSNGVQRLVDPELDVLFLRWYAKLDTTFDIVGSSHNGAGISAHYFMGFMSTPGVPADGTNKFLIEYECWRGDESEPNPGNLNVYIYHPEQRSNYGDHFFPNGDVLPNTSIPNDFGSEFVPRPNVTPELGRWYAYEVMLKANTPGMRDGRIALWLDGELIADFPNLRLRDVDTLTIDRFGLSLHAGSNPVRETYKWYDDVVAARSYIGPIYTP